MEKIIVTLRKIVSSAPATEADKAIAEAFPKISTTSASRVRKDVQDFLNGEMSESELRYYLADYGLA